MFAIKVENLTKEFDNFRAVDNISFTLKNGELFGLLGPNGAGKTTTINMLSTLLNPTSGYAEVAGFDVSNKRDDVRNSIGIVFQDPALDTKLTGRENLEFHAMMYGIEKKERDKRIKEVLELVELTDKADVVVEKYSGGMKRRIEIARGLIHRPKVLFLDEPTLGLDTQTRRHIWEYIKKLNKENEVTIILTTHYMEEADYLCDRVAIIDQGKIVALDTPQKLKDSLGGDVVCVDVGTKTDDMVKKFKKFKWIKTSKKYDSILCLTMKQGEKQIPKIVAIIQKAGIKIKSINLHKPSLDDVFIHYTGKTIREEHTGLNDTRKQFIKRRMGI